MGLIKILLQDPRRLGFPEILTAAHMKDGHKVACNGHIWACPVSSQEMLTVTPTKTSHEAHPTVGVQVAPVTLGSWWRQPLATGADQGCAELLTEGACVLPDQAGPSTD